MLSFFARTLARAILGAAVGMLSLAGCARLEGAQLATTNNLVLWLKADAGVQTNEFSQIVEWLDHGPHRFRARPRADAAAEEFPLFIPKAGHGFPALQFDGVHSVLEIPQAPAVQPLGRDWTIFFVAKRLPDSSGDFPQVIGSRPWVSHFDPGWAVSFDRSGLLASHFADGQFGHDVWDARSASPLSDEVFQIWQVEQNREKGLTSFFLMGDLDRVVKTVMPGLPVAQTNSVYLGREMDGNDSRRAAMELSEVLIYGKVLSLAERESVTAYLSEKYGWSYVPNLQPTISIVSPPDGMVLDNARTVARAAAADSDGRIERVEFYMGDRLLGTAVAPPYSLPLRFLAPGTVQLSAAAIDDRGGAAFSAPVSIRLPSGAETERNLRVTAGLQLWLKADAGVTTNAAGLVTGWLDQSSFGHQAAPRAEAGPEEWPEWIPSAIHGQPALRFDGKEHVLKIPSQTGLQPLGADWSVVFVARRRGRSQGDYPQIVGSRPWTTGVDQGWAVAFDQSGRIASHFADGSSGHDVPDVRSLSALSSGQFEVWLVNESRSEGVTRFFCSGHLDHEIETPMPAGLVEPFEPIYIGRAIGGLYNRAAKMDLAELLVYNRTLSMADRDSLFEYLSYKYGLPAVDLDNSPPQVTLLSPAPDQVFKRGVPILLHAEAADSDGSVTRVDFFAGTNLLGSAASAPFTVLFTNAWPGGLEITARAVDNLGLSALSAPAGISVVPPFWRNGWFISLSGLAFGLAVAGIVRTVSVKRFRHRMRLLQEQHAIEKERARIAQDIHDDIGASLTRIGMLSELVQRDAHLAPDVRHHARKISTSTRQLVQSLDEIVWAVNPRNDFLHRLTGYILQYAEQFFDGTPVRCRLEGPPAVPNRPVSADVRHNLFLAVKEALNNVFKHANAGEVWLRIEIEPDLLAVSVEDNGRGFLPDEVQCGRRNGLENMRQRLASLGGRFQLESRPKQGTRIRFLVPLR